MDERQHWMQRLDEYLQFRHEGPIAEGTIADDKAIIGQWIGYALERNVRPDERNDALLCRWVAEMADLAPLTQDNCRAHVSPWWWWNQDPTGRHNSVRGRPPENPADTCGTLYATNRWGPHYCACGSRVWNRIEEDAATYVVCRKTKEVVWVGAPINRKDRNKVVEATKSPSYKVGDKWLGKWRGKWLGLPECGVDPGPNGAESSSDDDDDDAETDAARQRLRGALESAAEDLLCDVGFLHKIVELLEDKKQVILYGPPGTGKTHFAQRLAQALADSEPNAETVDDDWMLRLDAYCLHLERDQKVQSGTHRSIAKRWIEFALERQLDPSVWDESLYTQFADLNPDWQDVTRKTHRYDLRRWCSWASASEGSRGDNAVSVVQFHPAYSYEDFFEGFRPAFDDAGNMTYRLTPGPLVRIAEHARANPEQRHVMVIDEINRANLPRVLGELLFLLEYRDRAVHTQYRPEERFSLPKNLWFIGTMNTADRSIALIDAAMRRRFHFVPFFPDREPTAGLLRRWCEENELEQDWVADLLDAVNDRLRSDLGGDYMLIGPSHFMKHDLDETSLRRIWEYNIEPLIEDQFFGRQEIIDEYRFSRVWSRHGPGASTADAETGVPDGPAGDAGPQSADDTEGEEDG